MPKCIWTCLRGNELRTGLPFWCSPRFKLNPTANKKKKKELWHWCSSILEWHRTWLYGWDYSQSSRNNLLLFNPDGELIKHNREKCKTVHSKSFIKLLISNYSERNTVMHIKPYYLLKPHFLSKPHILISRIGSFLTKVILITLNLPKLN